MVKQQTFTDSKARSLANLTPQWLPGESGNPAGRPRNSVTTILKNKSNEDNQALADKLWEVAMTGDMPAIREVLDRKEGKVADKLQLTGTMLVTTPDQLDFAMRVLLEDKLKLESRLLQETNPLRVSNEQGDIVDAKVVVTDGQDT